MAKFTNVTSGGIIAMHYGGSTKVLSHFTSRFKADISVTRAELTLLGVKMSDQGDYEFDLYTSADGNFRSEVELIVNCE